MPHVPGDMVRCSGFLDGRRRNALCLFVGCVALLEEHRSYAVVVPVNVPAVFEVPWHRVMWAPW